jgi:hypothetical protein
MMAMLRAVLLFFRLGGTLPVMKALGLLFLLFYLPFDLELKKDPN